MERIFCWRCNRDVPALSDEEARPLWLLWQEAMRLAGRAKTTGFAKTPRDHPAVRTYLEAYERVAGEPHRTCNYQAFHAAKDFASRCAACGKPFRTEDAEICAACGARR